MIRLPGLALGLLLAAAVPASAHHSLSAYDRAHYKTVEGTVKEFVWTNPHTRIILVVASETGAIKQWYFEGGSVNRLANGGFNKNTVSAGDKIRIAFNPMRNGDPGGFFLAVTASDGKLYGAERLQGFTKLD